MGWDFIPKTVGCKWPWVFQLKKTKAENVNKFFSEIGPKLTSKIPHSSISFEHFLPNLRGKTITDGGFNKALQTVKTKKSSGYDEISSDVIKHISPSVLSPWDTFSICL